MLRIDSEYLALSSLNAFSSTSLSRSNNPHDHVSLQVSQRRPCNDNSCQIGVDFRKRVRRAALRAMGVFRIVVSVYTVITNVIPFEPCGVYLPQGTCASTQVPCLIAVISRNYRFVQALWRAVPHGTDEWIWPFRSRSMQIHTYEQQICGHLYRHPSEILGTIVGTFLCASCSKRSYTRISSHQGFTGFCLTRWQSRTHLPEVYGWKPLGNILRR